MLFHREDFRNDMREIQSRYAIRHNEWSRRGWESQVKLLWDQDRIWGHFNFGILIGVFVIDAGPVQDHFQAGDEELYIRKDANAYRVRTLAGRDQGRSFENTQLIWRAMSPEHLGMPCAFPSPFGKILIWKKRHLGCQEVASQFMRLSLAFSA